MEYRRLIVQWDFVLAALPSPSLDTVTFEVKLFEGTNNIEFHYADATVTDDGLRGQGDGADRKPDPTAHEASRVNQAQIKIKNFSRQIY